MIPYSFMSMVAGTSAMGPNTGSSGASDVANAAGSVNPYAGYIGIALGTLDAIHKNNQAKKQIKQVKSAFNYNKVLVTEKALSDTDRVSRSFARYAASANASAAERGVGVGGSTNAILISAAAGALRDESDIQFNMNGQIQQMARDTNNQITSIKNGNAGNSMGGFMGGLQGLQWGMQIDQYNKEMNR